MDRESKKNELFQTAHIVILISYTLFSVILIGESLLLGWERWMIAIILASVILSWVIHIGQTIDTKARLWIYSLLMMSTYFFYGIHMTSTFDICAVMLCVITIYTMTGEKALVYLCQGTFFVTFAFDIMEMFQAKEVFNALVITRSLLHVTLILVTGWVSRVIIDKWKIVTENSQEELQDLQNQIERLNDFLANISHEIRTPVNAIVGLTNVCMKENNSVKTRNNLRFVVEAGQKLARIIGDILDYSEIEMDKLVVNTEDYMLSSLLNDIVADVSCYMRKNIELVIDVEPDIPSVMNTDVGKLKKVLEHLIINALKFTPKGGIYVHINAEKRDYGINLCIEVTDTGIGMSVSELEEICKHFYQADSGRTRNTGGLGLGLSIVNGFIRSLNGFLIIDSEPEKGTTVRVSIPQKVVDYQNCMSLRAIEDRNVGAYLNFERYHETHVRDFYNSMIKNLSLGLNLKVQRADNIESFKKLLKTMHFSHIFVGYDEYAEDIEFMEMLAENTLVIVVADDLFIPPENSNIRIMRKPFYCFPVISILNSLRDIEEEKERIYVNNVRALVVDDEPMNQMVADEIFSGYGMEVDFVLSGQEAIEAVFQRKYDVIFMDHMMPGMDGVEAMKQIRARLGREKKNIPIIALTANAASTAREMFIKEGFDGFIAKPIEINELEHVLKRVLPKSAIIMEKEHVAQKDILKEKPDYSDIELEKLGIDIHMGLEYCQNDMKLYKKILLQYAEEAMDKQEEANRYLGDKDFKNYEILVHSIKSNSKMIGALHLYEMTKKLEEAAEACREDEILIAHDEAIKAYLDLSKKICGLFIVDDDKISRDNECDNHAETSEFEIFMEFDADMGGGE